tara:strand:- start:1012 stop:1383 length:372 start_codon:yes stop_codon:yes gene_type:complete
MEKTTKKYSVTDQYSDLKTMFEGGEGQTENFDSLSSELINQLGELSTHGVKETEGITINLWKDRVWFLIEKAGLLPKYKDLGDSEYKEIVDVWYKGEEGSDEEEGDGLDEEEAYLNSDTDIEL